MTVSTATRIFAARGLADILTERGLPPDIATLVRRDAAFYDAVAEQMRMRQEKRRLGTDLDGALICLAVSNAVGRISVAASRVADEAFASWHDLDAQHRLTMVEHIRKAKERGHLGEGPEARRWTRILDLADEEAKPLPPRP